MTDPDANSRWTVRRFDMISRSRPDIWLEPPDKRARDKQLETMNATARGAVAFMSDQA